MKKLDSKKVLPIVLCGGFILVLFGILLFSSFYKKGYLSQGNKNPNQGNEIEEKQTPSPTNPKEEGTPVTSPDVTPGPVATPVVPTPTPVVPPTANPTVPPKEEKYTNEAQVIQYFQAQETYVKESRGSTDTSVISKIKSGFVTVVDFLFYGKEIGGYTFSQLTTTAKLQVIKIALSIDQKIDEYFPNYKDSIKKGYESVKAKAMKLYLDVTASLCEKVGDQTCKQAKEDFATMKKSFGFTFDLLKEAGGNLVDAIKTWYEIFRSQ